MRSCFMEYPMYAAPAATTTRAIIPAGFLKNDLEPNSDLSAGAAPLCARALASGTAAAAFAIASLSTGAGAAVGLVSPARTGIGAAATARANSSTRAINSHERLCVFTRVLLFAGDRDTGPRPQRTQPL